MDLGEIDSSIKSLDLLTDNRNWPVKIANKVIVNVFSLTNKSTHFLQVSTDISIQSLSKEIHMDVVITAWRRSQILHFNRASPVDQVQNNKTMQN